jgi:putative membrane protein
MLWIKAFHIIAVVAWFAGLFYLPRLFVYHSQKPDLKTHHLFSLMEYRLYHYIMTPAAICTLGLGLWLLSYNLKGYLHAPWMHVKLSLVALLVFYHLYLGQLRAALAAQRNTHSEKFYRYLNEGPTLLLIGIVIMVVVKPPL